MQRLVRAEMEYSPFADIVSSVDDPFFDYFDSDRLIVSL
jgi:hypothetical protein